MRLSNMCFKKRLELRIKKTPGRAFKRSNFKKKYMLAKKSNSIYKIIIYH